MCNGCGSGPAVKVRGRRWDREHQNHGPHRPGTPRSFYGVASGDPFLDGAALHSLGQGGISTLKGHLRLGARRPSRGGSLRLVDYDLTVAGAAVNGIRVLGWSGLADLGGAHPEYPPLGSALPGFTSFVRAAVARYGSGGTFWKEHPSCRATRSPTGSSGRAELRVLVEARAGPGSLTVLGGLHGAVEYTQIAEANVMLGGLFPTPERHRDASLITDHYRLGAAKLLDEAAVHPYAANPERAMARTVQLPGPLGPRGRRDEADLDHRGIRWASGGQPSGLTGRAGSRPGLLLSNSCARPGS